MTISIVLVLCACAPDAECFRPRTGQEPSCELITTATQFNLHADSPIQDLTTLCAASCIDVAGRVSIAGYTDLREAPLLARMRNVRELAVDVEGLTDLRGLENVDVGSLYLSTHGSNLTSFTSLEGLSGRNLEEIDLKQVFGLKEFDGSRFDHLDTFSADQTGLERIDLSNLSMNYIQLRANRVSQLTLGGGTLSQISIIGDSSLKQLTWSPELKVKSYYIVNNTSLSSCLVQDFINATYAPTGRLAIASNNGPCP